MDPENKKKLNIFFDEDNYIVKFKKYLLKNYYEYYIFLIDITKKKCIDLTSVLNCLIFYFISSKQLNFLFFLKNKLNKYDSYRLRSKKINIEEILIPEYNTYNKKLTFLKLKTFTGFPSIDKENK